MNETDIRRYAQLMRELELTAVEIRQEDGMVRLERSAKAAPAGPAQGPGITDAVGALPPASPASAEPDCISVKSPVVGVFYAAPAENAAPYVTAGDSVKKGQTLCLIEAMKLMNEIVAEEDGVIAEVCVTNGQVVEYGTELFRLRK